MGSKSDEKQPAPSQLGTKEYWKDFYEAELNNFKSFGDEGCRWFGVSAESRIVNYIISSSVPRESRIIDIGCGNGALLRELRKHEFSDLTGIDYCSDAIDLASRVCKMGADDSQIMVPFPSFMVADVLEKCSLGEFDIAIDKGTWDAISLSDSRSARLNAYKSFLSDLLKNNGIFILTSCNYTSEELVEDFSGTTLRYLSTLKSRSTLTFGGHDGTTSVTVVFQKRL
ncbi:hypothetical protein AB6A40_002551 [Gnathostoma spinigerum]|uniref:Protein-lysine N-methyltransferase AB6A40_002551 n=1 Tax=Gnathostoma spinigerum TaxID=75299 RepID=A0ABD6EGN4_9BILA